MAAAYLVTLPVESGHTLREGTNALVLYAESAAQAKEAASALYGGDAPWSGATATEIVASTFEEWSLRIRLEDPDAAAGVYAVDVTVNGAATTADTIDEIAALAVTALNALSNIAGAAYDSINNVLTIAAAGDSLGDHTAIVEWTHPDFDGPVASLVSSKVDGGAAGDAVTVTFPADSVVPPALYGALKS